jgi:hypothetical protein
MDKLIDAFIDKIIDVLLERAMKRLDSMDPEQLVTKYGKKAEDFFQKVIDKVF